MNKIICDICGTSYPETADQCPICGCAKDMTAEDLLGEYLEEEVTEEIQERPKGGRFAAAAGSKRKARYEEPEDDDDDDEDDEDEDDDYDDEDDDEEEEKSNAPLVVLLVIVIVALLAVTGFIFTKYFMPNMMGGEETTAAITEAATTQAQETTAVAAVPCTSLVLTSGTEIALEEVGFSWLIHVSALPENTTDEILFASSDEAVAIVGQDGTVTAVGEGTAVITITCGSEQLSCNVTCDFTAETTVPETTTAETSATDATVAETTVPETTVPETTVPETTVPETTAEADLPDVTISFVKSDVTSRMIGEQFYLKVNPSDLDPTLVTWSSENEGICKVDEEGLVTITGRGTTHVYAEYKGQKIECIVRVI